MIASIIFDVCTKITQNLSQDEKNKIMMMNTTRLQQILCLLTSLCFAQLCLAISTDVAASAASDIHLRGNRRPQPLDQQLEQEQPEQDSVVTCRVTTMHTMYESDEGNVEHREEHACIPIVNGTETPHTRTIEFPESIKSEHQGKIESGTLHVSIHGAHVDHQNGVVVMREDANFTIHEHAPTRRNLLAHDHAFGQRKLTIYRVSTPDSSPQYSASHIQNALFNGGNSLKTQYEACSGGKMTWVSGGVHEVRLPQYIGSFSSGQALQDAAIAHMGLSATLQQMGDNILFVTPPGVKNGFIAFAGVNWYISNFSDRWVNDLRALSHELAHNLGLNHAAYNGDPYGDFTGYMASTGGNDIPTGPRLCFNGYNHFQLKWFEKSTMSYHPASDSGRRVKLTSIVDANKASASQPVIIEITGKKLYLQYNEKRGFNDGVELKANTVTIVHLEDETTKKTDLKAGLDVGQVYSYSDVKIQVCERISTGSAHSMIVGIGLSATSNVCGLPLYAGTNSPPSKPSPPKKRPVGTPPRTGKRRCANSANKKVTYRFIKTDISKTCKNIPVAQRSIICKKQNVGNTNKFERIYEVCGNECDMDSGCGKDVDHFDDKPRTCAQEGRARVTFKLGNAIQNRKCKYIGNQGMQADVCNLPVIHGIFEKQNLRVKDVCEAACHQYAKCTPP